MTEDIKKIVIKELEKHDFIITEKFDETADLIESVEENPDTVISLINGKKIIVKEDRQEIKNLVKSYKRDIMIN